MTQHNKDYITLVTEREIDPEFGLFNEEESAGALPDAEEELEAVYPAGDVIADDTQEEKVPEADQIAKNSPVDPAAPEEMFHGTDLINGVGAEPEKETR